MILEGDSLEVLKTLEEGSVDTIITDPPYGYSFMGKDWDRAVPSVELWQECLRVLKPGAFMCVMSAPRSDVQMHMIKNISDAGFRVDFTPIYWTYASGFPKAANISKLVDKRLGINRELTNTGETLPDVRANNFSNSQGRERLTKYASVATSDQAKALDGSYAGFQPKPAVEVIIVAMKPLSEKTYVDQALANGKGISWLDYVRIPVTDQGVYEFNHAGNNRGKPERFNNLYGGYSKVSPNPSNQGRFPANLLVSDDVLNDGTIRKDSGHFPKVIKAGTQFESGNRTQPEKRLEGGGSYSRYFDLDKWAQTLPFLIVPKASKGEKNKGLGGLPAKKEALMPSMPLNGDGSARNKLPQSNYHPTVKPLKLMSYLITLFSRPGDIVLDPFVGSGTTVVAAKNLQRNGIGIEREAEYADIARARLAAVDNTQGKLF